ncbi:MAG: GNAT family N-acetyltransferase [Ruminococcus sp.]|uniref:GNAT family N-acetyltransferase n=1 Tax=Ruminococcus sp. TaxID=41978 RepID=UPI0025EA17A3|nr:GNAT family N-acetyltransferase [Ruminococcus sp.]MBR5682191.1 GNAT family N-acetyltransferase [Ruminococcus sp.]
MEIYTMTDTHQKWGNVADYAEKCSWSAGKYLAELMRSNSFKDTERIFAAFEGGEPVGFCTLTEKDELDPKYPYSPLIGFIFVDEAYRGRRLSEKMIRKIFGYLRIIGSSKVYIMSGEKGLYEKYGFVRMGEYDTIYGGREQLFVKVI